MEVHVLHALHDNFMYLIIDSASREAAAVDPADAGAMVQAANRLDVRIKMVLTTHHHTDHAGGNQLMAKLLPGVAIIGGKIDAVQVRHPVCRHAGSAWPLLVDRLVFCHPSGLALSAQFKYQ